MTLRSCPQWMKLSNCHIHTHKKNQVKYCVFFFKCMLLHIRQIEKRQKKIPCQIYKVASGIYVNTTTTTTPVPSLCVFVKLGVCSYHRFLSMRRPRSTVLDHVHKATVVLHLLPSDNDVISCDEHSVLVHQRTQSYKTDNRKYSMALEKKQHDWRPVVGFLSERSPQLNLLDRLVISLICLVI